METDRKRHAPLVGTWEGQTNGRVYLGGIGGRCTGGPKCREVVGAQPVPVLVQLRVVDVCSSLWVHTWCRG